LKTKSDETKGNRKVKQGDEHCLFKYSNLILGGSTSHFDGEIWGSANTIHNLQDVCVLLLIRIAQINAPQTCYYVHERWHMLFTDQATSLIDEDYSLVPDRSAYFEFWATVRLSPRYFGTLTQFTNYKAYSTTRLIQKGAGESMVEPDGWYDHRVLSFNVPQISKILWITSRSKFSGMF